MNFLNFSIAPVVAGAIALGSIVFTGAHLSHQSKMDMMMGDGISIVDAYIRANSPNAPAGAAFMQITNGGEADRLIAATSDIARRVELHTHKLDANGVASMVEVEGGIEIPANGMAMLKRGGDHVMFMGLNQSLPQGGMVPVILLFEKAGEIEVEIEIDHTRKAGDHSGH